MAAKYLLLLACITLAYAKDASDTLASRAVAPCTKPGFMCGDCYNSYICIEDGTGHYIQDKVESCLGYHTCLESTGLCTNEVNAKCNDPTYNYTHVCRQAGTFPHPFDCTKYFVCVQNNENGFYTYERQCDNGFGYDPLTTLCNRKLNTTNCANLITPCNGPEVGVIPQNPNLYYFCSPDEYNVYRPHIMKCPGNFIHNGVSCVDPTPVNGVVNGLCVGVGEFYDPNDCKGYVECAFVGTVPYYLKCAAGYMYNTVTHTCTVLPCPANYWH